MHSEGDENLIRCSCRYDEETWPAESREQPRRTALSCGLLIAIVVATVCAPALAFSPPPHAGGFETFSQGIPVWWPVHAGLMTIGFILLAAGFITARYHKTKNWFRTHKILQIAGAVSIFAGIFIGVYMVTLSGFPHLMNPHEVMGLIIGILLPVMVILGLSIFRVKRSMNTVRKTHRWLGRALIALILVNIVLGILTLMLVLGR